MLDRCLERFARGFPGGSIAAACLLVGWLAGWATPGWTQVPTLAPASEPEPSAVAQRLDFVGLWTDPAVIDAELDGPLWRIEEQPGQTIVRLPLRLTPADELVTLGSPDVDLAGARFIGWFIPNPDTDTAGRSTGRNARRGGSTRGDFTPQPRFIAGDSRFAGLLGDPNADPTRGALDDREPNEFSAFEAPTVPGPRLARSLDVGPDGTLAWDLDRTIPGAVVGGDDSNLYTYRLNPAALREQQPERPERLSRNSNETQREYAARQRAAQQASRAEQDAFRELRSSVQDLPDRFEQAMDRLPGGVVYAVFRLSGSRDTLTFEGVGPELPWEIERGAFEIVRALASGSGGTGNLAESLSTLQALAERGDAWSLRSSALALKGAGWLADARVGDPVFTLAERLITSDDGPAARIAVRALADLDPPTDASRRLLDIASTTDDPFAKLAALRASLRGNDENPAAVARILEQANGALADPNGPPADLVLASLAEPATSERNRSRRRGNVEATGAASALIDGVDFRAIRTDQRPAAVRWVVANAGQAGSIADGWLNTKLLASDDADLVRRTIEALEQRPEATNATDEEDTSASLSIPIGSADHGLFAALRHPNANLQHAAWRALSRFTIGEDRDRNRNRGEGGGIEGVFEALRESAVAAKDTNATGELPDSVVPFLERMRNDQALAAAATSALLRLIGAADESTRAVIVEALLPELAAEADATITDDRRRGSRARRGGRGMAEAFQALTDAERVAVAEAVYAQRLGADSPVTQLAAEEELGSWLAEQLDAGVVPQPADWLEPIGGETEALELAGAARQAIADGALTALAASIGADAFGQRTFVEQFGAAPRDADELQAAWPAARRELIVAQLAEAAGEYELSVTIAEGQLAPGSEADDADQPEGFERPPLPDAIVAGRTVLGIVELVVEADRVALTGNPVTLDVPEGRAMLRIAEPVELRNFPTPDAELLPAASFPRPLDLRRQPDGVWQVQTSFGPDHFITVRMAPVD